MSNPTNFNGFNTGWSNTGSFYQECVTADAHAQQQGNQGTTWKVVDQFGNTIAGGLTEAQARQRHFQHPLSRMIKENP